MEKSVLGVLGEIGRVVGPDRLLNAAGHVLQTVASTKQAVDDNVASLLSMANLPSRTDIDELRRQLDVMQITLANLSRKVDRLLEGATEEKAAARGPMPRPHSHGPTE